MEHSHGNQEEFFKDSQSKESVEFWSLPNYFTKYKGVFEFFFNQRISRLKDYNFTGKRIFDIGLGYGLWAEHLIKEGYDVSGIEPDNDAFNHINQTSQISSSNATIEEYQFKKEFDLITMFDVLEHLQKPDQVLKKLHQNLSHDGLLYLQVPDVLGLRVPYGHNLGLPYHLWQFNKKSIHKLLSNNQFEILNIWTGNQGIIGQMERGTFSIFKRALWAGANRLKLGNRIQVLAKRR